MTEQQKQQQCLAEPVAVPDGSTLEAVLVRKKFETDKVQQQKQMQMQMQQQQQQRQKRSNALRAASRPNVIVFDTFTPNKCAINGNSKNVRSITFPVDNVETNCGYCWDSCFAIWDQDGQDAHTNVRSILVPEGYIAVMYNNCNGNFGSGAPENDFVGVLESGCHEVPDYVVHFDFATESTTEPGTYILPGQTAPLPGYFRSELSTNHWYFGPSEGTRNAEGVSYYTYIFDLLARDDDQERMNFQVGIGGTWLTPSQNWQPGDPCYCDPGHWPPTAEGDVCTELNKTECTNGCCGINGCEGIFQSMEGGTGYWLAKLPTTGPKWALGSVTGCYKMWTNSPLDARNAPDVQCDKLGIAQVSNRLLLAPDGIAFQNEGMLGTSYMNTPIGKIFPDDTRNSWTLVLDAANFKGPAAIMLSEYWGDQGKYKDPSGRYFPLEDFSNVGMNTGGWAYEFSTIPILGYQSGNSGRHIKIPRMQMSINKGTDTTVLMTGFKSWDNKSHLYDVLEPILEGSSSNLGETTLLQSTAGIRHPCSGDRYKATLATEGKGWYIGGEVQSMEENRECVAQMKWDFSSDGSTCVASDKCEWKSAFELTGISITKDSQTGEFDVQFGSMSPQGNIVEELVNQEFTSDWHPPNPPQYNRLGENTVCGASPAVDTLQCVQAAGGDWMGYKWFKFVEQPAFQRLSLLESEKDWIQSRIVRLHEEMAANSPLNEWLKPPGNVPPLVEIDESQIVTPPTGMEVGYVPIVVYQGMTKPEGCAEEIEVPGDDPTSSPTAAGTQQPSSEKPTTIEPTSSVEPVFQPSGIPTTTMQPSTRSPSLEPTHEATSAEPSLQPTSEEPTPSEQPTQSPTSLPSGEPILPPIQVVAVLKKIKKKVHRFIIVHDSNTGIDTAPPVVVEQIYIEWPALPNKKLRQFKIGKNVLFDTDITPDYNTNRGLYIIDGSSWLLGDESFRTIASGETVTCELKFEKNVSDNPALYTILITFNTGDTIEVI